MNPMRISISITDPWEVGEDLGWQPFLGEILQTVNDKSGGRALIKLEDAINYQGSSRRYVIKGAKSLGFATAKGLSARSPASLTNTPNPAVR